MGEAAQGVRFLIARVGADRLGIAVMAGFIPAISLMEAWPWPPERDARHKAGHDDFGVTAVAGTESSGRRPRDVTHSNE